MIEKLQEIIRRFTDDEDIVINGDTILLSELGLNSYELVELVVEVENKLGVEIPDRKIRDFKTVQNVIDYISANG